MDNTNQAMKIATDIVKNDGKIGRGEFAAILAQEGLYGSNLSDMYEGFSALDCAGMLLTRMVAVGSLVQAYEDSNGNSLAWDDFADKLREYMNDKENTELHHYLENIMVYWKFPELTDMGYRAGRSDEIIDFKKE